MNTIVVNVDKVTLKKMTNHYSSVSQPIKNAYTVFLAKKTGVTITAYTSGKVMFQGGNAENEASIWNQAVVNSPRASAPNKKSSSAKSSLPENLANLAIIGSDEVGNGSYFGPLVVCATYADSSHFDRLKALGVKDSKMLNDDQIRRMAPKIKEIIPYKELIVLPEKYNEIQPTYNAVRMKVALHNRAICLLERELNDKKADGILIDQFTPENNYTKYLSQEKYKPNGKMYFVTKGEQYHLSVASASIICRASFLSSLDILSNQAGFTIPSGAGKNIDLVAAKLLKQGGLAELSKYAKLHFANTEKAKKLLKE